MSPSSRTSVLLLCPVFNEEQHLDSLITSLKQQTWSDWILVFGDNVSNDGTSQKIKNASMLDSRIRAFHYGEHLTVHDSFNRTFQDALDKIRSKYVQIIGADDCFASNSSLQQLVSAISRESGGFVAGNMIHVTEKGKLERNDFRFFDPPSQRTIRRFALDKWGANLMYSLFERNEFESLISHPIARFSSNLASDWWFSWVALNSVKNPVLIDTVTYKKFRKLEGFSSPPPKSRAKVVLAVFRQCLTRIGDRRPYLGLIRSTALFFWLTIAEIWLLRKFIVRKAN